MKHVALALSISLFFSNSVYASLQNVRGEYSQQSGITFFTLKETCEEQGGKYNPQDRSCFVEKDYVQNIIRIFPAIERRGCYLVHIEKYTDTANFKEFDGVVIKADGNRLTVIEGFLDENGRVNLKKEGCQLVLIIAQLKATVIPGKRCDGDLAIKNAEKTFHY